MKLVESQFDKHDNSVQALTARNQVLEKSIDTQKGKIETISLALQNASTSFGGIDKRTKAWQIKSNNAQAELNKIKRELLNNNKQLESFSNEFKSAEKSVDKFGDEVEDIGKQADEPSKKFQELLVVDWYKDDRTTSIVKSAISDSLDADLPTFYDKDVLSAKQI